MKTVIVVLMLLSTGPAMSQTLRYYDKDMNPRGFARQEGNRLVERDNDSNMLGYWVREGNFMVHRTKDGNIIGRVQIK